MGQEMSQRYTLHHSTHQRLLVVCMEYIKASTTAPHLPHSGLMYSLEVIMWTPIFRRKTFWFGDPGNSYKHKYHVNVLLTRTMRGVWGEWWVWPSDT
jgi:hypothetical protein